MDDRNYLPPILRPEFHFILASIVQYMNPCCFLRFIRSSKVFLRLANQGFLQMLVHLDCVNSSLRDEGEQYRNLDFPVLLYGQRLIDYDIYSFLSESPYLNFEINKLSLVWGDFIQIQRRLTRLLDSLGIRSINEFNLRMLTNVDDFMQKYKIHHLTARISDAILLSSQNVLQLENFSFSFVFPDEEAKEAIRQFILTSNAYSMCLTNSFVRSDVVRELIKKWMNGTKRIVFIRLQLESEMNIDPAEYPCLQEVKTLKRNLRTAREAYVRKSAPTQVPGLLQGIQNSFVFIDGQKNMLRVFFDRRRDERTVSLEAI